MVKVTPLISMYLSDERTVRYIVLVVLRSLARMSEVSELGQPGPVAIAVFDGALVGAGRDVDADLIDPFAERSVDLSPLVAVSLARWGNATRAHLHNRELRIYL